MTADIVSLARYRRLRAIDDKNKPDQIVAHWKCRVGICLVKIGVTATAVETLEMFNRELARRREKAIKPDDVMVCPEHVSHLTRSRW